MESLISCLRQRAVEFDAHGSHVDIIQHDPSVIYSVVPWPADPDVPVLYLTLYTDERPATPAEAICLLNIEAEFAPWISPVEHPITGLPALSVHPCRTRDWLRDVAGSSAADGPRGNVTVSSVDTERTNATLTARGDWFLWLQYFGHGVGIRV